MPAPSASVQHVSSLIVDSIRDAERSRRRDRYQWCVQVAAFTVPVLLAVSSFFAWTQQTRSFFAAAVLAAATVIVAVAVAHRVDQGRSNRHMSGRRVTGSTSREET